MSRFNDLRYFVSVGIGVLLAGTSYFFKDNAVYATVLLIAGASVIVVPLLYLASAKYILPTIMTAIASRSFSITFSSAESLAYAAETYQLARQRGGELRATHILQHRVPLKRDVAIKELSEDPILPLVLKRTFLFSDKQEESEWLNAFFQLGKDNLKVEGYFWKDIDLSMNKALLGLIPRFNLLLYRSNDGQIYRSLLGLERVRSRRTWVASNLNIGFSSTSPRVYTALRDYHESIIMHPEMLSATTVDAYQEKRPEFLLSLDEQHALKAILDYAYTSNDILHLGAFGSTALTLNRVCRSRKSAGHVSDLDLLIVTDTDKGTIKQEICDLFAESLSDCEVVFGDDDAYFYHFRPRKRVLVDLEIFERETTYYKLHKLLGYSIFQHYLSLFTASTFTIDQIIWIPTEPIQREDRISLTLEDRKGLEEFIERLESSDNQDIDPRRVLTINTENLVWAVSGLRVGDVQIALDYLDSNTVLSRDVCSDIRRVLSMKNDEIRAGYQKVRATSLNALKNIREVLRTCRTNHTQ